MLGFYNSRAFIWGGAEPVKRSLSIYVHDMFVFFALLGFNNSNASIWGLSV